MKANTSKVIRDKYRPSNSEIKVISTYLLIQTSIQFPGMESQTMGFCGCLLDLSIGGHPPGLGKKIKSIVTLAKILKKKAIG